MSGVTKVEIGVELEQDGWYEWSFAMRDVDHRLFQTFHSQCGVNVVKSLCVETTKKEESSQGAQIIVNGMMRFNRKADQGDKGGDGSRSSRKWWKTIEMAELEVGVLNGLVVPLNSG